MVLRDSNTTDVPADPVRASATPVLNALLKMESGVPLTDSECSRLCQIVFMPAISRKYQWVKSRIGGSPDSGRRSPDAKEIEPGEQQGEPDESSERDDVAEPDPESVDDYPHRLWGAKTEPCPEELDSDGPAGGTDPDEIEANIEPDPSDLEDSGSEEVPATENQGYHRDPFRDPVFTTAISELWARFSPRVESDDADDDGETGNDAEPAKPDSDEDGVPDAKSSPDIWQHALQAALRESDPDVRETAAIRYLRTCAGHELIKWLQEGGCWTELNQRLRKAIAKGDFTVLRAGSRGKGLSEHDRLVPAGHENWPALKNCPPYGLCRGLTFPSLRGGSQGLLSLLPTPDQFYEFLRQFFRVHRAAATVKQLIETALAGWKIHDDKKLGLPDDAPSDSDEIRGEIFSGEEMLKMSNSPNRPLDPIETAAARLIAAIEVADGCPIDPPPADLKAGKLGRLLLQYAIWAGLPCTDTESGKYGIESYAQLTGYGKTTENDRYHQKLTGVFRKLAQDYAYNRQMIVDLTVWLREKYFRRKPETVICDALTHGEQ